MRIVVVICSMLVSIGLLSLIEARSANAQSGVLVDAGRADFVSYCAACHGLDARGDGPVKPVLRIPPADLTAIAQRNGGSFDAGRVASKIDGRFEIVAHGSSSMPVWGRILGKPISDGTTADEVARGQIDALVSYLQSIQR
jgi:mono/diheme cytochrome c family protein